MTKLLIETIDEDIADIYGTAECGKTFEIGRIIERQMDNPLVEIPKPIGLNLFNDLQFAINVYLSECKGTVEKPETELDVQEVKTRMYDYIDKYKDPEGMIESFVLQKNFTPEEIDLMIETGHIYEPIIGKVKKV